MKQDRFKAFSNSLSKRFYNCKDLDPNVCETNVVSAALATTCSRTNAKTKVRGVPLCFSHAGPHLVLSLHLTVTCRRPQFVISQFYRHQDLNRPSEMFQNKNLY